MTTEPENNQNTENNDRINISVNVDNDGHDTTTDGVSNRTPPEQPRPTQPPTSSPHNPGTTDEAPNDNQQRMHARLERLGGEPAPDITPEEFAHLQQSGHLHIDAQGRVRSPRYSSGGTDSGVSLRKRRAWYHQ